MTAVFYPAVFHTEETGYSVTIPDIEGCFTQGETMDEAVSMAQDAIDLMLEDCEVCPKPSLPSAIHVGDGDFVAMIPFDFVHFANRQNKDCMIQYSHWKTYKEVRQQNEVQSLYC